MVDPFSAKVQALVVDNVGSRVVGINETTRQGIASVIETGLGVDGDTRTIGDLSGAIRDMGLFDEARAEVIARTETQFAFNTAALESYSQYGVEKVQAIDGDFDEVCAARNGIVLTVEEAQDIEDHPNGTLDWVPVRDDAEAQRLIAEYEAKEAARRGEPSSAVTLTPPSPVTEVLSAPAPPTGLANAVNDFERGIIGKAPKIEYGQIFDPSGKAITPITKGSTGRVTWRIPREDYRGNTLTHFHPEAAGRVAENAFVSLSDGDVITALDTRLGTIRAFSLDGSWMELRNNGFEFNSLRFRQEFSFRWKRAVRENWWGKPITDPARLQEAQREWNRAYRQTLIDAVNKTGDGKLSIVEGRG